MPRLLILLLVLLVVGGGAGCGGTAPGNAKQGGQAARKEKERKDKEEAAPPLVAMKADPQMYASIEAALIAVKELSGNESEEAGKKRLLTDMWFELQGDKAIAPLAAKLKDSSADMPTRLTVCRVLGKLGPRSAGPLLEIVNMESGPLRIKAVESLGRLKPTTAEIVGKLIPLIDDQDANVRRVAITAVGVIGPPAKAAVPRLNTILNDLKENETIRDSAAAAIKKVEPRKGLMNAH